MASPPRSSEARALRVDEARALRVDRLLRDLGADLRRGEAPGEAPAPSEARCATGLPEVDRLLGGGIPRGRVSEIAGPPSCGRTSLTLALLARATAAGHWAAAIDAADAFDPASAEAAGVDLARVLWVRPASPRDALRSAEHVLGAGGFALVALDLALAEPVREEHRGRKGLESVPTAAWTRLRKLTAGTDAALLVLGYRRLAGSFADLAVEMEPTRSHFARGPDWFEGLEGRIRLVRNRTGPGARTAAVRWQTAA